MPVTVWDNAIHGDLWQAYIHHTWTDHVGTLGISARFSSQHRDMLTYVYGGRAFADLIYTGGVHATYAEDFKWVRDIGPDDICLGGSGENFIRKRQGLSDLSFDELQHPVLVPGELESYWDMSKPHDKVKTNRWVPIEFSRGCGRYCTFCCVTDFWGLPKRHSLEWIKTYLDYLLKHQAIEEVLIEDDSFNLYNDWTWEVIQLLNARNIWWSTPNGLPSRGLLSLSDDRWRTLTPKCWRLSIPFETGSPHTANLMRIGDKFLGWEEAQSLVLTLRERGIEVAGFFIIGYPGERPEDIRMTLSYANSLPLTDRYIYIATPYPGTELYHRAKSQGTLLYQGPDLYQKLSYRSSVIETGLRPEEWRTLDRDFALRKRNLL